MIRTDEMDEQRMVRQKIVSKSIESNFSERSSIPNESPGSKLDFSKVPNPNKIELKQLTMQSDPVYALSAFPFFCPLLSQRCLAFRITKGSRVIEFRGTSVPQS